MSNKKKIAIVTGGSKGIGQSISIGLSEKNIESSLNSYIKLLDQLHESEILLIKSIDLRNHDKAIINFKQ